MQLISEQVMIRGSFESLKPVDETYNSRYRYFRHVLLVTRPSILCKSSSIIKVFSDHLTKVQTSFSIKQVTWIQEIPKYRFPKIIALIGVDLVIVTKV